MERAQGDMLQAPNRGYGWNDLNEHWHLRLWLIRYGVGYHSYHMCQHY